ncbi:MAG: hypothetical protein ACTHLE_25545 [Agriterribacter sp.]
MLELPVTARIPEPEEMSHRHDIEELLLRRKKALIVEGYRLTVNNNRKIPYAFQAEININNSGLWSLVMSLAEMLPAEICLEYSLDDESTFGTDYLSKALIFEKLRSFETELVQDCALAFTLSAHSALALSEIIVTSSKYIRFSGNDKEKFLQIMSAFTLKEIPELAFIDEYPKITEPLKKFIPTSRRPEDVIWSLNRAWGIEET